MTTTLDVFAQVDALAKKLGVDLPPPGSPAAAAALLVELRNEEVEKRGEDAAQDHADSIENGHLVASAAEGRDLPVCSRCAERLPPDQAHGLCPLCKELRAEQKKQGKIPKRDANYKAKKCHGHGCTTIFKPAGARQEYCTKCKGDPMKQRTTQQKLDIVKEITRLREGSNLDAALKLFNMDNNDSIHQSQYYAWRAGTGLGSTGGKGKNAVDPIQTAVGIANYCLEHKVNAEDGVKGFMDENPTYEFVSVRAFQNSYRHKLPEQMQAKLRFLYRSLGRKGALKAAEENNTATEGGGGFTGHSEEMLLKMGKCPKPLGIEIATAVARIVITEIMSPDKALVKYSEENPDKPVISRWTFDNYRREMPEILQKRLKEVTRDCKKKEPKGVKIPKGKPKVDPPPAAAVPQPRATNDLPTLRMMKKAIRMAGPETIVEMQLSIDERKEAIRKDVQSVVQEKANQLALLGLLGKDDAAMLAQLLDPAIRKDVIEEEPTATEPTAPVDDEPEGDNNDSGGLLS